MTDPYPQRPQDEDVTILIVDDHTLFRQGLRHILESEAGFSVAGEAADGDEAVKLAKSLRPHVILMDISMPFMNGIEAALKIKKAVPGTHILFLTMHENPFLQEEGQRIGASGYILKKSVDRELFDAIRKILSGSSYFPSPSNRQGKATSVATSSSYDGLSLREKEILRMLAGGMTNKEIAGHLHISVNTVETHRKNFMKKLNLHNLSEVIKYALVHGIIQR